MYNILVLTVLARVKQNMTLRIPQKVKTKLSQLCFHHAHLRSTLPSDNGRNRDMVLIISGGQEGRAPMRD
jgi:lysine/ornithine N-monooxygenase